MSYTFHITVTTDSPIMPSELKSYIQDAMFYHGKLNYKSHPDKIINSKIQAVDVDYINVNGVKQTTGATNHENP